MPELQSDLPLDATAASASPAEGPAVLPELRDEMAAAWRLPIGERVEISFLHEQLDTIAGILEIAAPPSFPWNPREPLALRVAGFAFSSRDIAQWTRL
jgi:hypothetical protein